MTNYEQRLMQISDALLNKNFTRSIEKCIEHTYFNNNEAGFDVHFLPNPNFKGGIIFTPAISFGTLKGLKINNTFDTQATDSNSYTTIITAHTHRPKHAFIYNRGPSTPDVLSTQYELERMKKPLLMIKQKKAHEFEEEKLSSQGSISYFDGRITPKTIPVPIEAVINCESRSNYIRFYQLKPGTIIPKELYHHARTNKLVTMLEETGQMIHHDILHPHKWNKKNIIKLAEKFAESSFPEYK